MKKKTRFKEIRNILLIVLFFNWSVSFLKILYGLITRCASMSADGMHSFSDGTSNVIGLIGIWMASQPVDRAHPYGHKKYETFATIGIGFLLAILSFNILRASFLRFIHPVIPQVTKFSFVVMIFTLVVNFFVMRYEVKRSKVFKSDILFSDAMHTRSDIWVSISVIFTLISIKMGLPIIDTIVAVVIALLIAHSAYEILKESSNILCDRAAVVSGSIKNIAMGVEGVKECHKIRTRGRHDDIHVDMHVLVKPEMHVGAAHNAAEIIEKKIKEGIPDITDVVVHIEPVKKNKGE